MLWYSMYVVKKYRKHNGSQFIVPFTRQAIWVQHPCLNPYFAICTRLHDYFWQVNSFQQAPYPAASEQLSKRRGKE